LDLLKQRCPRARILLASGIEHPESIQRLMDKGADGFLRKPFTLISLSTTVRELFDRTVADQPG
jgi:DNA-binding NarL/FixJ family response regulator